MNHTELIQAYVNLRQELHDIFSCNEVTFFIQHPEVVAEGLASPKGQWTGYYSPVDGVFDFKCEDGEVEVVLTVPILPHGAGGFRVFARKMTEKQICELVETPYQQ